jgi:ComF family protein
MSFQKSRIRCTRCQDYPEILKSRSYARYHGSLLKAIISLKYRPNQEVARIMGRWLAELLISEDWQATIIVPVPLSTKREKQRGYNQAELIARGLASEMKFPLRKDVLKRTRDTGSQVGLDTSARYINVRDAFVADSKVVEDQVVILVDDLLTTGATMVACSRALLHAGVRKVYGLTVARA